MHSVKILCLHWCTRSQFLSLSLTHSVDAIWWPELTNVSVAFLMKFPIQISTAMKLNFIYNFINECLATIWKQKQKYAEILIVWMIDCYTFGKLFYHFIWMLGAFFHQHRFFHVGFEIQSNVHFKIIFHGKITTHFSQNCNWIILDAYRCYTPLFQCIQCFCVRPQWNGRRTEKNNIEWFLEFSFPV